jgi:OmpA-OmpF porin, OOP family
MGLQLIRNGLRIMNIITMSAWRFSRGSLLVSLALVLSACGALGGSQGTGSQLRLSSPAEPSTEDFPPLESAHWKEGGSPSLETLRLISTGMGKDSVRQLLSWPHFKEGFVGVREWNYIFHLPKGKAERVTCQYMLRFDEQMLTSGAYWKTRECEMLTTKTRPTITPAEALLPEVIPPQKLILGVDQSFRSRASGAAEISMEGMRTLRLLASEIRRNFRSIQSIIVTGHSDRTDANDVGDAQSLAWATAVRDALIQQRMDPSLVHAVGVGRKHPLVECSMLRGRELTACLRPNRRVEVEIAGTR